MNASTIPPDADRRNDARRSFLIGQVRHTARPLEPALYLVATPIGNLGDITLRGLEVLAGADILACEDTRVTRSLLTRYDIRRRPVAYHEHNAEMAGSRLVEDMVGGKSVALVSDADTPLVSDPGYRLVEQARSAGVRVVPVPGASALLAALTGSGLPSDAFFFAGFLPVKEGQRRSRLETLKAIPGTLVFFESPHRVAASLASMAAVLGARQATVARELTKTFEEFRNGDLDALAKHYDEAGAPRGEIVVCVAPPAEETPQKADVDRILLSLAAEMPASKAASEVSRMTGEPKQVLYRRLLALKDEHGA